MKIKTMMMLVALVTGSLLIGCQSKSNQGSESAELSGSNKGQAYVQDEDSKPNILQIALQSPDHKTLVAAVKAAEAQNTLVNAGPLTVFAPNDAAFDKLPEGAINDLLKPENKNKLVSVINGHASPANYKPEQLKDGTQIYLANGRYVKVEVKDGKKYVDGAKILGSVDASNGRVYVVDKVLL
jgi:uncharacterized surface protein with fasciclin (FAS1) repeats